jgi:hypothetical protein
MESNLDREFYRERDCIRAVKKSQTIGKPLLPKRGSTGSGSAGPLTGPGHPAGFTAQQDGMHPAAAPSGGHRRLVHFRDSHFSAPSFSLGLGGLF